MKPQAEFMRALRARRRKDGLRPMEVWAHEDDKGKVREHEKRLLKKRGLSLTPRM